MQAPSGEKRGGRRIGVHHLMPGLGCSAPSPAFLPFSVLPWPPWGPHQPRVQVSCSPIRFLGQHPGFLAARQEPSSPGTVPPLPRSWDPCPFLTPASLPLPFTCRAWLGAAPSKQERQGRAGERPSVSSQTHLLDPPPLGRSLCLSFPLCNTLYTMPGAG